MRWYLVLIFGYVFAVLQTSLFVPDLLAVRLARPDLLLLLAIFIALSAAPHQVFFAAWGLGLVADLIGMHEGPLGLTALLFAFPAYGLSLARSHLVTDRILVQVLLAAGLTFAVRTAQVVLHTWLTSGVPSWSYAFERAFGDAIYTALLAPYLLWLLAKACTHRGRIGEGR